MRGSVSEKYMPSAVISLDNVLYNVNVIRSLLPKNTGVIAVVKDNCYGCGCRVLSRFLQDEAGIDFFAVASTPEAVYLRNNGIHGSILVLGKATEKDLKYGKTYNLLFTCTSSDDLERWATYAIPVNFHVEIDTGMRRFGVQPHEVHILIKTLQKNKNLNCCGLFTHMTSADDPGTTTVTVQVADFELVIEKLHASGIYPSVIHVANSATILRFPGCFFTHVRPGIVLYGCKPDPRQEFLVNFKPVLSLCGNVVSLREVPVDTKVSYGGHYQTKQRTCIATVAIGYAQGVPRYLSNRGALLIGGKKYLIAGNVTMDYIMVDVGLHHDISVGDQAVVIGNQGSETITPDDVAQLGNTIGYEVLCGIGQKVHRTYMLRSETIDRSDIAIF